MADFDLAILGSGFGGSLLAMIARRLGKSVVLLERGTHPRFAIGESSTPLSNLLLEEIARRWDLPRLLPLTAYGHWKRAYPDVGVGLKRGFTYYGHRAGARYSGETLLVAASPGDEVSDTHWLRADFDHFLLREAQALGAESVDRAEVRGLSRAGGVTTLAGERDGRSVRYRARFVVDATGPRGALSRLLDLPATTFAGYPRTQGVWSHFTDVRPFAAIAPDARAPYPPDAAAVHHVFDGGWAWVLRFDHGVTSAGFAATDALMAALGEGEEAWRALLRRLPSVGEQFAEARAVRPFVHRPLPYRCGRIAGEGWALLPSAAAFVDPYFSSGFVLTLLGLQRLGAVLEGTAGLDAYAGDTLREADAVADLVSACYATFADFAAHRALALFYFAAASHAEMARRLGRPAAFLLQDRPAFRDALRRACAAARAGTPLTLAEVRAAIAPFDVAGFSDPARRDHFPVDPRDAIENAHKLGATPDEVAAWFATQGM